MRSYSSDDRLKLKYDYATWIAKILNGQHDHQQWRGYIVTFMFNQIYGSIDKRFSVMENEIERVYATLVRHAVHHSRSPSERRKLPILYAFPDYPRQQANPSRTEDVTVNDGLHYHGIIAIPARNKLKYPLPDFIEDNYHHFVKLGGPLRTIHIEPIDDGTAERAASYAFKGIEWKIPDSNRMLILPKALSELPDRPKRNSPPHPTGQFWLSRPAKT